MYKEMQKRWEAVMFRIYRLVQLQATVISLPALSAMKLTRFCKSKISTLLSQEYQALFFFFEVRIMF